MSAWCGPNGGIRRHRGGRKRDHTTAERAGVTFSRTAVPRQPDPKYGCNNQRMDTSKAAGAADGIAAVNAVDRRIAFICGLHRSGTSVLHRLLASHPLVSGFANTGVPEDEGQHLQSVYSPAKSFGGPGRFGFNARAHMDETHALASRVNAERIFTEWARHWDLGARLLIEKSPPNLVRTRFLQALFPNALFVIVMRHPIAVACATEKWRRWDGIERLIEHWLVCHEKLEADIPHLTRSIVVRYESLTAAPDQRWRTFFLNGPRPGARRGAREARYQ